ncbi:MAG: M28 family peptidase [Syntrophales bacterium]
MIFRKFLPIVAIALFCLTTTGNTVHGAGIGTIKAEAVYRQAVSGEGQVLKRLNPLTGWNFAKALSRIGSNTEGLGFRYAGGPAGAQASKLVYDAFKNLGLNPVYDEFPITGWSFREASLNLKDSQNTKIRVVPMHGTPPTPATDINAEIVFVGSATRQDLHGKDLSGKIALVEVDLEVVPWYTEAADQCQRRGAVAVVFFNKSYFGKPPHGEAFWVINLTGAKMNIPVLNTPVNDGRKLKAMILVEKSQAVPGTLISHADIIPDGKGKNVIASIRGSKYPDEYIIVSAHTDAHFYGFQDDALPAGLLITMAKAVKESRYRPDRTILFIAFDAEEGGQSGTHYSWLAGSWQYARKHAPALAGKVVANVNLELLAAKEKDYFAIRASDTLFGFTGAVNGTMKLKAHGRNEGVINGINTWNDEWSLGYFGIPTLTTNFQYQLSDKPLENNNIDYYHSQFDDEKHADFGKYADCAHVYTSLVLRLDREPFNPYDLSLTPAYYLAALNQDSLRIQGYDDSLKRAAASFAGKAKKLAVQQRQIAAAYAAAPPDIRKRVAPLIPQYNRDLRAAAKTVIMGTSHLDWDIPSYQVSFYQEIPGKLAQAVENLKKGDGKTVLDWFSICGLSAYYARFLDYQTWRDAYRESIEGEKATGDRYWGTGRVLKYYDVYPVLAGISAKVAAGNKDFTSEIESLSKIAADVQGRLQKAVGEDTAMWQKAEKELPMELAGRIMALLKR